MLSGRCVLQDENLSQHVPCLWVLPDNITRMTRDLEMSIEYSVYAIARAVRCQLVNSYCLHWFRSIQIRPTSDDN